MKCPIKIISSKEYSRKATEIERLKNQEKNIAEILAAQEKANKALNELTKQYNSEVKKII